MRFVDATYWDGQGSRSWLSYDDVTIVPGFSDIPSRKSDQINLSTQFTAGVSMNIPIISANMDTITEGEMAVAMAKSGGYGILHKYYKDKNKWLDHILEIESLGVVPSFSVGVAKEDVRLIEEVLNRLKKPNCVVTVDVAHGHHQMVFDQVRRLKLGFPNHINVIAGNICTPAGASFLIDAGADGLKCCVGGGSLCTTRRVTGCGVPNLSSIMQVRRAINGRQSNTTLIADGGIRESGDIVKALAAGADSVMIGGLLAATSETPGKTYSRISGIGGIFYEESTTAKTLYKKYRGQSSREFNEEMNKNDVAPEGESQYVQCKGPVTPLINELCMGLRSGMSYIGAKNLKELQQKAVFIEITHNAHIEGTPHGITK